MYPCARSILLLALSGCLGTGLQPAEPADDSYTSALTEGFAEAAEAEGVPDDLLIAIGWAETRLQMISGVAEFPGQEPAHGIMALRGANLQAAADLVGLDVEDVKVDRDANILASAALLASWADEEGIDKDDLGAWAPVVARYSGIVDNDEATSQYVHDSVYSTLEKGLQLESGSLPPVAVTPDWPPPRSERTGDAGAVYTQSPNYNSRGSSDAEFIIVHSCEGAYSGCWSWLANSASGVSAHYVVNDAGTEVRQLVDEDDRAWHISASYDCNNNGGVDCVYNGSSTNTISVGIEHAGYASQASWDPGLISRSAELARGIADRHGIPLDSYHIVGHGQLQPWDRTDPGPNWPWTDYLSQIQGSTPPTGTPGGTPPTDPSTSPTITIDSNNGANVTSNYYVEVSSSWTGSANVSGYWNTGYWWGRTDAVSDPASFWFHLDNADCFTVEAWWTAAYDRTPTATFIGWDPGDQEVGRATVNQQINGAHWNQLGNWEFEAGWNRVLLSRWTTAGDVAVADAVRVTPSATCP